MSEKDFRPVRSVLYMPASNAKAIEKARTLDCDAVILDLEDAVAPTEKDAARNAAVSAVEAGGFGRRLVAVRVNSLDTPWGRADLEAFSSVSPDVIIAPKIASADDVNRYNSLMSAMSPKTKLWIMIETARSIFALEAIADVAPNTRLAGFVMGTNDLCKEINSRLMPGRAALLPQICLAATAAKMAGLMIIDGVYNDLQDDAGFERECMQGLEFGLDGKTLIHPRQIDIANRAFSPTPSEIEFSKKVIQAFEDPDNLSLGALKVEGKMVERLHLAQCERLVRVSEIISGGETVASED